MRYIPLLLRYFALLLPFPGSSPFTFAMPSVFFHFSDWRFRPDGCLTPPPKPSPLTPAMPSYFVIFFDRRFWLVYLTLRLILSHFRNAIGLGIFPEDAFDWTAHWTLPLSLSQALWTSTFFCLALLACRRPETPFPPPPSHDPSTLTPAMPSGIRPVGALSPPDRSPLTLVNRLSFSHCHFFRRQYLSWERFVGENVPMKLSNAIHTLHH